MSSLTRIAAVSALALIAGMALTAVTATGERAQVGNVVASLQAELRPHFLPRERAVPVTVEFSTDLRTDDGNPLPPLRRITLVLGGDGRLEHRGLPVCREDRIRATTESLALGECGDALVGSGHLEGSIQIAGQRELPFRGRLLLFNGRLDRGGNVALAGMVSKAPPVSFVFPFRSRQRPTGALELTATLPHVAGASVRVNHIDLKLGRRFGPPREPKGYLNASCPVPPGFTAFVLPVVEATYEFVGGRRVSVVASRGCSVRH